ncbi:MAG TPA: hypothetical protein VGI88_08560 [Verrucomicrobiae bacterium]
MNRFFSFVFVSCLLLQMVGCSEKVLNANQNRIAEKVENIDLSNSKVFLYSVQPHGPAQNGDTFFHERSVLGLVEITSAREKAKLMSAFVKGIRKSDGHVGRCFNPRHGIRIVAGTTTNDFVICFECHWVLTFGFKVDNPVQGVWDPPGEVFPINESPSEVFNEFLDEYHIKKADE